MAETVSLKGVSASLSGPVLNYGDTAPEAVLVTQDLKEKNIGGAKDKPQLIITVPSLDTSVCEMETRKFNEMLEKFQNVYVDVVSKDLPFAQNKFCESYNVKHIGVVSDFRYQDMEKFGVLISEGPLKGLLARCVFILDKSGKVIYKQLVSEVSNEPDYGEVIHELEKL